MNGRGGADTLGWPIEKVACISCAQSQCSTAASQTPHISKGCLFARAADLPYRITRSTVLLLTAPQNQLALRRALYPSYTKIRISSRIAEQEHAYIHYSGG
ncbi:hypothetical protein XPA_000129 [Xanthoria parietina]